MSDRLKDHDLSVVLRSPSVSFGDKASVLQEVLPDVEPLALNLAYLLTAKNRLGMLDDLVSEYDVLLNRHYGREHAEATVAIQLDEEYRDRLRGRLAELTGKDIVLTTNIDPTVLGGVVIRVGDKLIDGSVRNKLDRLGRGLREAGLSGYVTESSGQPGKEEG